MRYTEFIEDIGDIAAGGVGKLAGAIADLPGVLSQTCLVCCKMHTKKQKQR